MTISTISNFIFSNVPFIQPPYQLQAIKIFGKELAESLKVRDGTWEKVMESWNISLKAWKIIKESENNFCKLPKRIYCETQVNDGLIFKASKTWSNENQKYNYEITKGKLITPHGYIYLKFHDTKSMNQFITRLEEAFYKKSFDSSISGYSFVLDPNKIVTYKPSYYYDTCGSALKEEFGKDEYSRTQALNIYEILSDHAGITMEGQAISHNIY